MQTPGNILESNVSTTIEVFSFARALGPGHAKNLAADQKERGDTKNEINRAHKILNDI